jgi:hypothetical protein
MIALHLPAVRPVRSLRLPLPSAATLRAIAWYGRWFLLGLAIGAVIDLGTRFIA